MEAVGPDFFTTLGMPLVAGRGIGNGDEAGAPAVTVINESAARQYFPGRSPIGQTLTVSGWGPAPDRPLEIVGVVADARYDSLRNPTRPTAYDSYLQRPGGTYSSWFAVRVANAPSVMERPIRDAVTAVDPSLPITHLQTQQEQIDQSIGRERVLARLLTVFGAFALLLASVGLYGLTSYAVARRTSEIGIRLALGAQRSQVLWLVLRQVFALSAIGLALGLPLAWAIGPLVGSYLFGVPPRDVLTIALAGMVLMLVIVVAGWLPARRAARMDPLAALRVE
jgi:predicted permease